MENEETCRICRDAPPHVEHINESHHTANNGDWLTCQHENGGGGTTMYNFDYCPKCGTEL